MDQRISDLAAQLFPARTTGIKQILAAASQISEAMIGLGISSNVSPFLSRGDIYVSSPQDKKESSIEVIGPNKNADNHFQVIWKFEKGQDEAGKYLIHRIGRSQADIAPQGDPKMEHIRMAPSEIIGDVLSVLEGVLRPEDAELLGEHIAKVRQQFAAGVSAEAAPTSAPALTK